MSPYEMTDHAAASAGGDEDEVMRELLRMIFEQIWLVLGVAALIIFGAVIYAKLATRIYSADALIQVEAPNANTSGAAALAALSPTGGSSMHTDAEIEIIKSRTIVEPIVEQFKLNFSAWPKTMPYLGKITQAFASPGHPMRAPFGLDEYAWGGERFNVDSLNVPKSLEGVTLTLRALGDGRYEVLDPQQQVLLTGIAGVRATMNQISLLVTQLVARPGTVFFLRRANQLDAVMALSGGLQVSEKGHDTGIVQLSYTGVDPRFITTVTNAVAQSYMRHRTERAQEEASKMLGFLNSELPRLREELKRSETALSEYQSRVGSFQPTQEAQVFLSGGLEYEKQIAALRISRAQLLQRFTLDSPEVQTLDAQLAALTREKSRFEEHFKTLPGSEREAVSLQRDAKVAEEVYVALLNKTQELSIARAGTIGNVHIIDEALVPSAPIKPKAALIVAAGVVLGLMAGVALAFCRRTFMSGVEDPDTIERRFQLPVLASITFSAEQARRDRVAFEQHQAALSRAHARHRLARAKSGGLRGAMASLPRVRSIWRKPAPASQAVTPGGNLVLPPEHAPTRPLLVKTEPFDVSVEGLRGLRATLQFGLIDAPNRIICVTSPAPADGKSFLCANLSALLTESGQRVLLIDADMRRGRLSHYFGRSPAGGLTELLTGQIDLDVATRQTGIDGLHFIAAGANPPNPSEILSSSRFANMVKRLEAQFDLVIIDTPPLLAAADAAIVANMAGSTILVIRAGAHSERNISESMKKLRRARARVVGSVVNAMSPKRSGRNGTYDYAYAYAYSARGAVQPDEK